MTEPSRCFRRTALLFAILTVLVLALGAVRIMSDMLGTKEHPMLGSWSGSSDPVCELNTQSSVAREGMPFTEDSNEYLVPLKRLGKAMDVIKSDFLVNDDTIGGCEQSHPSVSANPSGRIVVAWEDSRDGDYDVYCQRYDGCGNAQGGNFRVNDDAGSGFQFSVSVATNSSAEFVVAWGDSKFWLGHIWCQLYDSLGAPRGSNVMVGEGTGGPSVAINSSGGFVVAWAGGGNVYWRSYDSSGTPDGNSVCVGEGGGVPSLAMDGMGNYVIVWKDIHIYCRRYDSSGMPQESSRFRVNDDTTSWRREDWCVGMDDFGNFVITWEDDRNGNLDVHCQRYDLSATPQGNNFQVNDDTGTSAQGNPSIAVDRSGDFMISWQDKRDGHYDIYCQLYDSSGVPQGGNFQVNDDTSTSSQEYPCVTMMSSSNYVITWHDARNSHWDIYGQCYDSAGTPQGGNFRVNDDMGSGYQNRSCAAMDRLGNFIIAWQDWRSGSPRIYYQYYDSTGMPRGVNCTANEQYGVTPSIAMSPFGDFVIAWAEWHHLYDIYCRFFDSSGTAHGNSFRVNDLEWGWQEHPCVAMDRFGNFVLVWQHSSGEWPFNDWDIHCQYFDSSGTRRGANFRVNDPEGVPGANQSLPSVAMGGAGNFVVVWEDKRNGHCDIYCQRYDSSRTPLGDNFRVNDDIGSTSQGSPSVAMDSCGDFVIVWHDKRNGRADIYGQFCDSCGIPIGSNFRVNDDPANFKQYRPSVAMDPGGERFVVAWTDFRHPDGEPELFAQKYEDGLPAGYNVQINEPDLFPSNHQEGSRFFVACNHNIVCFTWKDNRRHRGWDIYGKLTDWGLVEIQETDRSARLSGYRLILYPNPFDTEAFIKYGLPQKSSVCIVVYNLLGQQVRTLIDSEQEAGLHTLIWDATDDSGRKVSSGPYFLRLEAHTGQAGKYTATRKLSVIR